MYVFVRGRYVDQACSPALVNRSRGALAPRARKMLKIRCERRLSLQLSKLGTLPHNGIIKYMPPCTNIIFSQRLQCDVVQSLALRPSQDETLAPNAFESRLGDCPAISG